jgi:hypothetical protein
MQPLMISFLPILKLLWLPCSCIPSIAWSKKLRAGAQQNLNAENTIFANFLITNSIEYFLG